MKLQFCFSSIVCLLVTSEAASAVQCPNANLLSCDPPLAPAFGRAGASAAMSDLTYGIGVGGLVGALGTESVHHFGGLSTTSMFFEGTIERPDNDADGFGHALSFDGHHLFVAAPDVEHNPGDPDTPFGRVYTFTRGPLGYDPNHELEFPLLVRQKFGSDLDVYGEWAVISPVDKTDTTTVQESFVWLYRLDQDGNWIHQPGVDYLAPDPLQVPFQDAALWGGSVAISGQYLVVGGWNAYNTDPSSNRSGTVYVYEYDGTSWGTPTKLPVDPDVQSFGWDVDVWGDTIIVGAPQDVVQTGEPGTGRVFFFEKDISGWIETADIPNPDPAVDGQFGFNVAIGRNLAIIGDPTFFQNIGVCYQITRSPFRQWQESILFPIEIENGQEFGSSVATNGQGFLVGASGKNEVQGVDVGGLFSFEHVETPPGTLTIDVSQISVTGGTSSLGEAATMTVDFGPQAAGQWYAMAGTNKPLVPGQDFSIISVPSKDSAKHIAFHSVLTPGNYFNSTISGSGSFLLENERGQLDAMGQATIVFQWPYAGFGMGQVGKFVTHTVVLVDDLHYETNPVTLELVP